MRTKLLFALAFVVVAGASFYAGGEFILRGGSFGTLVGAPKTGYSTFSGQVVSSNSGSVTIRSELNGDMVIPLSGGVQLLRSLPPSPGTLGDLSPGASVTVTFQDGAARMIQIFKIQNSAPLSQ